MMKNYVGVYGIAVLHGASSPGLTKYTSEELAARSAKESNEWSDGLGYHVLDEEEAQRYAEYYGVNFPHYAFDEEGEIVNDEDIPPPNEELLDDDAFSGGFAPNH